MTAIQTFLREALTLPVWYWCLVVLALFYMFNDRVRNTIRFPIKIVIAAISNTIQLRKDHVKLRKCQANYPGQSIWLTDYDEDGFHIADIPGG